MAETSTRETQEKAIRDCALHQAAGVLVGVEFLSGRNAAKRVLELVRAPVSRPVPDEDVPSEPPVDVAALRALVETLKRESDEDDRDPSWPWSPLPSPHRAGRASGLRRAATLLAALLPPVPPEKG